jgi:hypothetical protein
VFQWLAWDIRRRFEEGRSELSLALGEGEAQYLSWVDLCPKKAVVSAPSQYRLLSRMGLISKAQSMWIHETIKEDLRTQVPEYFFGWRRGKSAADMLVTTTILLAKASEFQNTICVAKIDLYKFFDSITFDSIYQAMVKRGIPESLAAMCIRDFTDSGYLLVLPGNSSTCRVVSPRKGTPQGHVSSPDLANAVLADAFGPCFEKWVGQRRGVKLITTYLDIMHFGDDGWIFGASGRDLEAKLGDLTCALKKFDLVLQPEKSN